MFQKSQIECLTYSELNVMLPSSKSIKRMPLPNQLRSSKLLFSYNQAEWRIDVYENGLFIYASGGRETTYAVDRCSKINYRYDNETISVTECDLGNCKWYVPLVQIGETRLNVNNERSNEKQVKIHFLDDNIWDARLSIDPYAEMDARNNRKVLYSRIRRAYTYLTIRQKQAVALYLQNAERSRDKQLTQAELGKIMGVSHQGFSYLIEAAFARIKKYF